MLIIAVLCVFLLLMLKKIKSLIYLSCYCVWSIVWIEAGALIPADC